MVVVGRWCEPQSVRDRPLPIAGLSEFLPIVGLSEFLERKPGIGEIGQADQVEQVSSVEQVGEAGEISGIRGLTGFGESKGYGCDGDLSPTSGFSRSALSAEQVHSAKPVDSVN